MLSAANRLSAPEHALFRDRSCGTGFSQLFGALLGHASIRRSTELPLGSQPSQQALHGRHPLRGNRLRSGGKSSREPAPCVCLCVCAHFSLSVLPAPGPGGQSGSAPSPLPGHHGPPAAPRPGLPLPGPPLTRARGGARGRPGRRETSAPSAPQTGRARCRRPACAPRRRPTATPPPPRLPSAHRRTAAVPAQPRPPRRPWKRRQP